MQDNVDTFIKNMLPGQWFIVDKMCKPENLDAFILCIRKFIAYSADHWRYEISDNNYTVLRNHATDEETFDDWLNKRAKKPDVAKRQVQNQKNH